MDRNLALELVRVTEAAALASARFLGKGDPRGADRAAVAAMELAFEGVKISGHIVIGELRTNSASKLCAGDVIGSGGEGEVDVALDPLECTDCLADGQANAVSAIAVGPRNVFRKAVSPFMRKIAVGKDAADRIDLSASTFDNLVAIAEAKRVYVEDLTIAIVDRKHHQKLIEEVRQAGSRIELVRDGDLAPTIATALPGSGIDVMMGIGDSDKGIIAAAAIMCLGGEFLGQYVRGGDTDDGGPSVGEGPIYRARDLVGGENIMFAATGVSYSDILGGTMFRPGGAITHSMVLRSKSGTIRLLTTEHFFDKVPDYT
ncbi:MAG TPA: fructose-bisphosphatase class II family protein [Patescibacteria group bacterium]|nr:fructose-bisphosphatase class II family protein [Patescibacteria group bacterium]